MISGGREICTPTFTSAIAEIGKTIDNARIIVPRNNFFISHPPLFRALFRSLLVPIRDPFFLLDKFVAVILLDESDPRKLTKKSSIEPASR